MAINNALLKAAEVRECINENIDKAISLAIDMINEMLAEAIEQKDDTLSIRLHDSSFINAAKLMSSEELTADNSDEKLNELEFNKYYAIDTNAYGLGVTKLFKIIDEAGFVIIPDSVKGILMVNKDTNEKICCLSFDLKW